MFLNVVPNSSLDKESVNLTKFLDVISMFPKVEESERSFESNKNTHTSRKTINIFDTFCHSF